MSIQQILSSDIAGRLGWTLLHSLWQGAAAAALLAVARPALRFHSPQSRYAIALGSLGILLIATAVTFRWSVSAQQDQSVASIAVTSPAASVPSVPPSVPSPQVGIAPVPLNVPLPSPPRLRLISRFKTRLHLIVPWVACAWVAGVLLVSLWHAGGWIAVQRLRRLGTQPVDPSTAHLATRIARLLNLHVVVRIVQSVRIETPLVVGWLRPMILLPVAILAGLKPEQLEAILAHELAHVRRHDYLLNLVQVAAETLMFYHPAVWWISRRIRLEREQCCDDIAVSICGDRFRYVESLAALEEVRLSHALTLAARGSGGSELMTRVQRLLAPAHDSGRRHSFATITAGLLVGVAVTTVACMQHSNSPKEVPATMTVEELVQHLAAAEQQSFRNLTIVDFELTTEFRPEGSTVWEKTPYRIAGTAYLGDMASGAARLDISQETLPAKPDMGKWYEMAYSIGSDGAEGREVHYKFGELGHPLDSVSASTFKGGNSRIISEGGPKSYATGVAFSAHYVRFLERQISAGIKRVSQLGTPGHIERVKLDGRDMIRYSFVWGKPPVHTGTVWFDPNRNYTQVAQEVIRDGKVQMADHVTELAEAAPGFWYPVAATYEGAGFGLGPKGTQRYTYRAKKVIANDPAFDPKNFIVPFPPNALVQAEHDFTVGKSGVQLPPPIPQGANDNAQRVKSANNLRQLGQMLILYANEFNGLYPPDLATVAKAEEVPPEVLKSPMGDEKNGYDYVYLHYEGMGRRLDIPEGAVIAYDAPDAAKTGGASVLFGDGHVEWLDATALKAALAKSVLRGSDK